MVLLSGLFEVQVVTPPKESLGIHALPPDTHNGDQINIDGKVSPATPSQKLSPRFLLHLPLTICARCAQDFVVSSLVLQYKLVGGRYQRDHNRLDVQVSCQSRELRLKNRSRRMFMKLDFPVIASYAELAMAHD